MTGKSVFSTPNLDKQEQIRKFLENNKKVLGKKKASLRKTNPVNIT